MHSVFTTGLCFVYLLVVYLWYHHHKPLSTSSWNVLIGMGRQHYSSAHWQDVSSSLRKITQWERRSSLISSPEVYASNQHVATSLLAVVTIWLIMRGRKKQNISFKSNISNRPFYCCVKTAIDICKPISFSLLFGVFLISLISSGVLQHSKAIYSWHEYNTGHINILPKFIGNLLQVWMNCHMGCLEYYSLLGLAHCSGHLILLLLLCGDVEVNPGPYEEEELPYYSFESQKTLSAKHLPTQKNPSIDYKPYNDKIEFILSVASDSEYEAAITYIGRPSIEDGITKSDVATILEPNTVVVGKFAGAPVALVKTRRGSQIREDLERELKHFQNAKYILCIGTGCGFQKAKIDFGDVFISSKLTAVKSITKANSEVHMEVETIEIEDILHNIFCSKSLYISDCNVSNDRTAKYLVDNVISGVNSVEIYNKASNILRSPAIGGDMEGKELVHLKNIKGFIVIKSVTEYFDGSRKDTWNFTATMAALHYVKECLTPYIIELIYVDAYRHFINTKDALDLLFLKFLFLGPPRLGKTTARRRLMGEITDLLSAGEAEQPHPSTGAVESGHSVIVRSLSSTTAVVTQAEWSSVENLTHEARMLFHMFVDSVEAKKPTALHTTAQVRPPERVPERGLFNKFISKLRALQRRQQRGHEQSAAAFPMPTVKPRDIPEVAAIFKEATKQPEFWNDVKHSFKVYLRTEDTGGQPELMDMLPALTIGPGLYLLFFSYEMKLKGKVKVFYQSASGKSTLPEQSTFTLEEMLLSALSSISCSSAFANLMSAEETSSSDLHKILESPKSVAYIVGTHKDKVSEDYIESFDKELQRIVRDTDFFEKDVVQFYSEDKLVISMDNMEGGAEEVNEIRKLLEIAMEKHFKKLRIPGVWLLFSLCLRMRDVRTACMNYCLELSSLFNMSPYETKVALWFLHHHAGVMMYFPNVPGLEDLVIIDIQVVYDSVTSLILRAMRFDNVGQATAEKFRRTGQFVLKDLIAATAGVSKDLIPPLKLVALLEYLHIVARIFALTTSSPEVEDEVVYIMPCILHSANKDKLDAFYKDTPPPNSIAPLMVRYKCGFVPIGVFPAMIASLIANKSFELIEEGMMKNLVQFRYGSLRTLVTIISQPKFYEILISKLPKIKHDPHTECIEIRKEVESTIEKVGSCMNYGYFMDYQFAFECPTHPGRDHLCVCIGNDTMPKLMLCLQHKKQQPVMLNDCHKVWFYQPRSHLSGTYDTKDSPSSSERVLENLEHSVLSVFMSVYADLVVTVKPCVHSVADHCLSVGLISEEAYDIIIQRHDLLDTDKARILLSHIRDAVSQKPESLLCFITVLNNVGDCEELVHKLQKSHLKGVGISYSQQLRLLYPAAHQYLDKMVDWDRDSVCPDLYRIAYSLLQWDTLAPQLGLNHIDVEDIKQDYRTTKEQRIAALLLWKQRTLGTYHDLLKVCCDGGDSETASAICDIVNSKVEEHGESGTAAAAFMRVYIDLVQAMMPCVNSVADHCLSTGLISIETYDTIVRRDLIDRDKARILLSSIRCAILEKAKSLNVFVDVLTNVGGFESLVHEIENHDEYNLYETSHIHFQVPTRSPSNLRVESITAVSAIVTWKSPPIFFLNGRLTKYALTLTENDKNILKSYYADVEKCELLNLRPFTKYSVEVAACNSAGCGPRSHELSFTTDEAEELPYYSSESQTALQAKHLPTQTNPNIDYKPYNDKIEFILSVASDSEYEAAITYIGRPSIEDGMTKSNVATILEPNTVVVGKFAGAPVALVKTRGGSQIREDLERELKHFQNAKYILCIGTGCGFQKAKIDFGDIFISSKLTVVKSIRKDYSEVHMEVDTIEIDDLLYSIFCSTSINISDCDVSKDRTAKYLVDNVLSGVNSVELYNKARKILRSPAIGGDMEGQELVHLKNIKGFIVIKSVTEYIDGSRNDTWKFTGTMAVLHYVKECLTPYIRTERYVNAYNQMIASEENIIKMLFAKVIFLGPPGRGKTVTRRRLFGEIVNISKEDGEQPSTGVIDAHTFVMKQSTDRTTAVLSPGDNWRSITMLKDEKQLLCKLCHWALTFSRENKNASSKKSDSSTPKEADREKDSKKTSKLSLINVTSYDNVCTVGVDRETMNELPESSQDSDIVYDTGDQPQLNITFQTAASDSLVDPNSPFKAMDSDTLTEKYHVKDFMKISASPDSEDNIDNIGIGNAIEDKTMDNIDIGDAIDDETMDNIDIGDAIDDDTMDKLPDSFQNSCIVYMQDTGGQPELMDMLPALTIGPALYLLFCRLNDKLNETFEVRYRDPSVADKGGKSKLCLSDYILTIFSSIFCVHQAEQNRELDHKRGDSITKKKQLSNSSTTVAYIIGTYRDEVDKDELQKFDKELQEIVKKTEFFEKGLIKFMSPEDDILVYPIDNKTGNEDEIIKLQQFLEKVLKQNFKELDIPACWLAFNLSLRSRGANIMSLKDCILYGKKCHMSEENTKLALWFFHHHAGILMHFPEVKDLEDIVIVDTQFIYDSITRLILLTLQKKDIINQYQAEDFQKNGKLTFELLEKACGSISPQKFLALLKHFNVLAPIPEPESSSSSPTNVNEMFFMPCILSSISDQSLDDFRMKHSCSIISSLRICFVSGFVPVGVFSALIASLVGKRKAEFKLIEEDVKKNCVQFHYGKWSDKITIMSRPSLYEAFITIENKKYEERLHEVCSEVKKSILKVICDVTPSNLLSATEIAFECPDHEELGEHQCIVDKEYDPPKCFRCQINKGHSAEMQSEHLVWYEVPFEVKEPSEAPSNVVILCQSKHSVTVTWNPPPKSSWNGFIRKYEVKVEYISCDPPAKSSCNEKYEVDGISHDKMEYLISNLSPGTEYSLQVSACTSAGPGKWSDPYKFTTYESVPSESPNNVKYSRLSSTSATIRWNPPPQSSRNGVLTGYTVILKKPGDESRTTCTPQETEYTFPNLKRHTTYFVQVSANTSQGDGPESASLEFSTPLFDYKCVIKFVCVTAGIALLVVTLGTWTYFMISSNPSNIPKDSVKDEPVNISANLNPVTEISIKALLDDLEEIGNWELLCTHLEVNGAVMDTLRHSGLDITIKKERCLSAYIDSGEATWDHVVKVVCSPPFNKIKLGKKIAKRHKVKLEMCIPSTKDRDL